MVVFRERVKYKGYDCVVAGVNGSRVTLGVIGKCKTFVVELLTCVDCGFQFLGNPEDGSDLCECSYCVTKKTIKSVKQLKEVL